MTYRVRRSADLAAAGTGGDWGSLAWLTRGTESPSGLTLGRVVIRRGRSNPEHLHTTCDELLYLLSGRLRHTIGDDEVVLEPGDVLELPRGTRHRAYSIGDVDAEMIVAYNSSDRDFHPTNIADSFVASPMCFPRDDLKTVLERFSRLGFTRFEAFTSGPASALDIARPSATYRALAAEHGIAYQSVHLPVIDSADPASLERARAAVRFAAELGALIALYKAASIDDYVRYAPPMLDAADDAGIVLVIQNHAKSVLSTDDDVSAVIDGVSDPRLRVLLEVGHYEKAGISWSRALERFRDSISYCHVKDMKAGRSVVFGTGDVDLAGLFHELGELEYGNGYVLELEARDLDDDPEAMETALRTSLERLDRIMG